MASLNADSAVGPYEMDPKTHDDKVKSYFVNAGLPSDQVAAVITSYILTGVGQAGSAPGAPQLHSLNSTLRRAINGIAVPDSYAWAKMTTSGDVDAEAVFWPPIDASVVSAAQQFSNAMQDGAKHSQYLAKLPAVAAEGGVVIHHSDPSIHSSPTAFVSFDAKVDAAGGAAMHHFDVNGVEFRLPHEANAASGSSRQRP